MLLVDIGNTTTHFAVEKEGEIIRDFKVTSHNLTLSRLKNIVSKFSEENIGICSVVPSITTLFKKLKRKVFIVGENITVPMRCIYNKKEVGQDRLVNAFAARNFFPKSRLIIDFGTAITFDFLSSMGDYLGGFIFPGIGLSLKGLSQCALLPKKIKLERKDLSSIIPKNTQESISRGIIEGISLMVEAMVKKYKSFLGKGSKVIITGGEAPWLIKEFSFPYVYEPLLIFKGLLILTRQGVENSGKGVFSNR